ncbi:MAG: hypothetical protein WBG94_04615, partial [Anaerolineales bacterium]
SHITRKPAALVWDASPLPFGGYGKPHYLALISECHCEERSKSILSEDEGKQSRIMKGIASLRS